MYGSVCGLKACSHVCSFTSKRAPSLVVASGVAAQGRAASTLQAAVPRSGFLSSFVSSKTVQTRTSSAVAMSFFGGCEKSPSEPPPGKKLATFAGGCFWGLELAFQRVAGVEQTAVGYTQGKLPKPSYQLVCTGMTGHTEAVQVVYDPNEVTFQELADVFFDKTDPTTLNQQGYDVGTQYRSGIYFHDEDQKAAALSAVESVQKQIDNGSFRAVNGKKVVVEILPAADFYMAEDYHQQYLEKGGRNGSAQSAAKGCKDTIRCYG